MSETCIPKEGAADTNPKYKASPYRPEIFPVVVDHSRDDLLTPFGKATLSDRYLVEGESYQDLFARVAGFYAADEAHAQRLYDYISKHWFMPATPILSNGGTTRGLPISCYLNSAEDSLEGIVGLWNENVWLASKGGGIGSYWGNLRSIGEPIGRCGKTSGVIPFIRVMDSLTLAISQGCVDGDTEILTECGWVRFEELGPQHGKVYQIDDTKFGSFVEVQEYHKYPYTGKMHLYANTGNTVNHLVTPNHRMVYETLRKIDTLTGKLRVWTSGLRERESKDFKPHRDNRIYTTGPSTFDKGCGLTPIERLWIAYQADGARNPSGCSTGSISGEVIYNFRFTKPRKIARLVAILEAAEYRYTKSTHVDGVTCISVRFPLDSLPTKDLSEWVDLTSRDYVWCMDFVQEVFHWDGHQQSRAYGSYSSTEKENADLVNAIACMAGYKSAVRCVERDAPRQPIHVTHILRNRATVGGEEIEKTEVDFSGHVYCVSVPSGRFLARRNGVTIVTGNSMRRGSAAVYLPIWHPEIEEFIEMRRPTGGDPNRKALNLHHGIMVSDEFMYAVERNEKWHLRSPKDNSIQRTVRARDLWIRILTARMEQGEPYIIYSDTVNRARPEHHKLAGLEVKTSNLCAEITLPTGIDHHGKDRTAVCCLSSLNLETWDDWHDNEQFFEDVMLFLDNVLQDFIERAPDEYAKARYAAMRERSIGLGVMGFHSYLQARGIPFESALAKSANLRIFKHIRKQVDAISVKFAHIYGPCPDAEEFGIMERWSNKMAIAPTASISTIAGNASPGVETLNANVVLHKTLSGNFTVRNRHLKALLARKGHDTPEVWSKIILAKGSVKDLDVLTDDEKAVYRTAFEIDPRWVIEHAADRAPLICQAASNNLFLPADIQKRDLHMIHYTAWKKGVKSLYYCRSLSIQRAENVSSGEGMTAVNLRSVPEVTTPVDYDECLACQ